VPFATRLLSSSEVGLDPAEHEHYTLGPVVYALVMLVWGAAYIAMVLVARRAKLWRPDTRPDTPARMIAGAGSAMAVFAVSIPLAFVSASLAQYSWLLIPVVATSVRRLRRRRLATVKVRTRA
jgi:hypothetical protein